MPEFDAFYRAGDEIAAILSGLIDATVQEEAAAQQSSRPIKEGGIECELPDDDSRSEL